MTLHRKKVYLSRGILASGLTPVARDILEVDFWDIA
jgi:hypothetical protein